MQPAEAESVSQEHLPTAVTAGGGRGESLPRSVTEGEPFTFRCPACRKLLLLNEKFAGLEGPCPKCGTQILSADPSRRKPARLAAQPMPEPPVERRVWSPPAFPHSTESVGPTKPLPLQKPLAKTTDLPRYDRENDPNRAARQQRMLETLTFPERLLLKLERLNRPETLSRLRMTMSLLTIVAVVFGILLLRSRGQ